MTKQDPLIADMLAIKIINLVLAFAIELATIAALGLWGYTAANGISKWIFGIGAPLFLMLVWSVYAAPASNSRLNTLPLLIFKIAVFALAIVAFYRTGHPIFGAGFGIVSIVSLILAVIFRH